MLWNAELIRVSLFPISTTATKLSLEQILGKAPDEVTERPQQGFRHEVAQIDGGHIFLTQQPGRADLFLGMVPNNEISSDLVSIGPYDQAKSKISEVAKRFLQLGGESSRVAYAPTLIAQSDDRIAAYRVLGKLLPSIKVDASGSRDLLWQINRPRPSKTLKGAELNRFMRWSVVQHQTVALLSTGLMNSPQLGSLAVRLEIDLSTPAQPQPLALDDKLDVFQELVLLADEIAEKGDIA